MAIEPTYDEVAQVVEAAISRHPDETGQMLNVLREVQDRFRYVPFTALDLASRLLETPFSQTIELVSSFSEFSVEPVGRHLVVVCDGTACHAAGAMNIVSALEDELGVKCGQTTEDGAFTLRTAYCVGSCGLAPIIIVDTKSYGKVRLSEAGKVLRTVRRRDQQAQEQRAERPEEQR